MKCAFNIAMYIRHLYTSVHYLYNIDILYIHDTLYIHKTSTN